MSDFVDLVPLFDTQYDEQAAFRDLFALDDLNSLPSFGFFSSDTTLGCVDIFTQQTETERGLFDTLSQSGTNTLISRTQDDDTITNMHSTDTIPHYTDPNNSIPHYSEASNVSYCFDTIKPAQDLKGTRKNPTRGAKKRSRTRSGTEDYVRSSSPESIASEASEKSIQVRKSRRSVSVSSEPVKRRNLPKHPNAVHIQNARPWTQKEMNDILEKISDGTYFHSWVSGIRSDLYRRLSQDIGTRTPIQVKNKMDSFAKGYRDIINMAEESIYKQGIKLTKDRVVSICKHFSKLHPMFGQKVRTVPVKEELDRLFKEFELDKPSLLDRDHSALVATLLDKIQKVRENVPLDLVTTIPTPVSEGSPMVMTMELPSDIPLPRGVSPNDSIHIKLLALQEQELKTKQVMAELEIVRLKTWSEAFKESHRSQLDPGNSVCTMSEPTTFQWELPAWMASGFESILPKSSDAIGSIQRQEFKARKALMELDLFRIHSVLSTMEPPKHLDSAGVESWNSEIKSRYNSVKDELDRLRRLLES